jgi:pyrimidine deaminase RibD-like protein
VAERDTDWHWLKAAIELSARCPQTDSAFSVGAIVVSLAGTKVASGFSRETDPKDHAEEVALCRAAGATLGGATLGGATVAGATLGGATLGGATLARATLAGATLYSSLEPCLARVSRPVPCAELIVRSGVRRVVIAWREPPIFQPGGGATWLASQGIEVVEIGDLAPAARAVNRELLNRSGRQAY